MPVRSTREAIRHARSKMDECDPVIIRSKKVDEVHAELARRTEEASERAATSRAEYEALKAKHGVPA